MPSLRSIAFACTTLLVGSAALFSFGCAEDADLGLTQAALTTEDQRACFEDCMAAGGEERDCIEACIDWDHIKAAERGCYEDCVEAGGSEEECRERCSRPDDAATEAANACYEACVADGGDADTCREDCYADVDTAAEAPVEMTAEECYAQCEAAGGTDADCDERCGDGAL